MTTSAPWLPEEQWKAGDTGSYYGDGAHKNTNYSNDYYCVDFNLGAGDYDKGSPVLAVADGSVTIAHPWNGDSNTDPLGNHVRIKHSDLKTDPTKTYESLYAHLNTTPIVVEKQLIRKGQVIGFVGSTGHSNSPHLHHCLYQKGFSVEPDPMDGQTMADEAVITSKNTNLFDITYNDPSYSPVSLGTKEGLPHWYYAWNNTNLYESTRNNVPNNIYIQYLTGGTYGDGAIVYDALGGARKTYLIHSGFWLEWSKYSEIQIQKGGPRSELGAPINNEYEVLPGSNPKRSRQDFQLGYLLYQQGTSPEVTPYTHQIMPGMYTDGWHPDTSYAFAEAYANNKARNTVGEPDANLNEIPYVHEWCTSPDACVTIQDFWNGTFKDNAIILNKNINTAFVVRTGFWDWYKNRDNNGPLKLGAPLEDEKNGTWNGTQCVLSQQAQQEFEKGLLIIGTDGKVAFLQKGTTLQKSLAKENMCYPPPDTIRPAAPASLTIQ